MTGDGLSRRDALRRLGSLVLAVPLAALSAGCGSSPGGALRPVAITPEDTCARCGMLIDDMREAAEILGSGGRAWKFDDLGEMFAYRSEHHLDPHSIRAMFVHDYETRAWLRAERAVYVATPRLHTAMNFGLAAFADPVRAERFAATRRGRVLSYPRVLARPSIPFT